MEPTWEWKKPLNRGLQVNCLIATKPGLPFQIWRRTYRLQRASTAFKCECECHCLCPYLNPTNWWPVKEVSDLLRYCISELKDSIGLWPYIAWAIWNINLILCIHYALVFLTPSIIQSWSSSGNKTRGHLIGIFMVSALLFTLTKEFVIILIFYIDLEIKWNNLT